MSKISTYLARVKTMSFKRMSMYADRSRQESGRLKAVILADMIICSFKYGVGYQDYYLFGFANYRKPEQRRSFMTMNDNIQLVRRFNDPKDKMIFEDKPSFDETFSDMLGRDFVNIGKASEDEIKEFVGKNRVFFAKTADGYGGFGVKRYEGLEPEKALEVIRENHFNLLEQPIVQHEKMSELNGTSVNSLRIVTLLGDEGDVNIMYALVRVGRSGSDVDNVSSGGMYAPIGKNGEITAKAFCDKTGEYYEKHPDTGVVFKGFAIPMYERCIELVTEAAKRVPTVRYVGWDVGVTENGPVLIEGNTFPGYDMCQNHGHISEGLGILPAFENILGEKLR